MEREWSAREGPVTGLITREDLPPQNKQEVFDTWQAGS